MKILFVCLGNICRSPMAEGVFRQKAKDLGLDIEFDSCGTGDWHAGESQDERAQDCMLTMGNDISDLRARQFRRNDFQEFDRIYTMDESNHSNILALATTKGDRAKVDMILNAIYPDQNRSVPDPYFGNGNGFLTVYDMLNESADQILSNINS